tara:strand:+ start:306 stop:494 length:189 start_codon:yes stop_codon:yes gene_type:complete
VITMSWEDIIKEDLDGIGWDRLRAIADHLEKIYNDNRILDMDDSMEFDKLLLRMEEILRIGN